MPGSTVDGGRGLCPTQGGVLQRLIKTLELPVRALAATMAGGVKIIHFFLLNRIGSLSKGCFAVSRYFVLCSNRSARAPRNLEQERQGPSQTLLWWDALRRQSRVSQLSRPSGATSSSWTRFDNTQSGAGAFSSRTAGGLPGTGIPSLPLFPAADVRECCQCQALPASAQLQSCPAEQPGRS